MKPFGKAKAKLGLGRKLHSNENHWGHVLDGYTYTDWTRHANQRYIAGIKKVFSRGGFSGQTLKAHIKMNHIFFLTTVGEYLGLTDPRECVVLNRVKGYNRDDYALVKITPPLSGQGFGLGGEEIEVLLLATVLKGETLFSINKWPVYVYVGRIKDKSVFVNLTFELGQVDLIAKGVLYRTFDEAANVATNRLK